MIVIDDDDGQDDDELDAVLQTGSALGLTADDVECLRPREYLNDAIVDYWIDYLFEQRHAQTVEGIYCFRSLFWVKLSESTSDGWMRWTSKIDLSATRVVLIPVCQSAHWTLVLIRLVGTAPMVMWLDSLGGCIDEDSIKAVKKLLRFVEQQRSKNEDESNKTDDNNDESNNNDDDVYINPRVTQQKNLTDCGLFMLEFIEAAIRHPQAVERYSDQRGRRSLFPASVNRSIVSRLRRKRREILAVVQQPSHQM